MLTTHCTRSNYPSHASSVIRASCAAHTHTHSIRMCVWPVHSLAGLSHFSIMLLKQGAGAATNKQAKQLQQKHKGLKKRSKTRRSLDTLAF